MPQITIVTPSYNRAHTLPRVFDSLKKQTFQDFKWIIMDDGSTDNTRELVESFKVGSPFEIDYYWNQNTKKFYTVFEGISKVKTDYFVILDSDDAYVEDGLEKMYNIISNLNDEYISATFNSQYPNGNLVGTLFPDGRCESILEMRYKFKVKGDKHTIFKTQKYLRYLKDFDYSIYKGKYAPQKIFFNIYDGYGEKSKFINYKIRIYFQDENDLLSMSNDRIKPTSYFGLLEGYKSFLNSYGLKLLRYPKALLRNLIGYQVYAIKNNRNLFDINNNLSSFKLLSVLVYPFSLVFSKFR